jgi:two-component system NtrC family sensor kinase
MLKTLDSVTRSVERCSAVTHRLLGFTRSVNSREQSIDISHLLREVLSFTGKEALHRNITIHGLFSEETPSIKSERSKLEQIFLNIVNNAFAAVSDGGRIDIGAKQAGPGWVEVTIADDGEGIEEEMLAHVFEPFFSTKGGFGTGLGLSITYELVQQLGGRIEIESKIGKGTKVTVMLPTSPANER